MTWEESQIEDWEKQSDSEFLKYFEPVLIRIDEYDPNKLGKHDLYVYNRYKQILRNYKLGLILTEGKILNFNQFKKFF